MAFVITDTCVKDELCVEVCPVDCIHPKHDEPDFEWVPQLYINPQECIDCGACVPACPANAIFGPDDLPFELGEFEVKNRGFYACRNLAERRRPNRNSMDLKAAMPYGWMCRLAVTCIYSTSLVI